jgi:hypothetical protein
LGGAMPCRDNEHHYDNIQQRINNLHSRFISLRSKHVVAGLELPDSGLDEDVDVRQPFHGGDAVPVGHDEPEGRAVVGDRWPIG